MRWLARLAAWTFEPSRRLAALAVEECGKALCLISLAVLPRRLRTRAPVGRMLEWPQLKQVGGLLIAAVPIDGPGLAAKLAAMPAAQATQILATLSEPAEAADRLKRCGLYVDMDRTGRVRQRSRLLPTPEHPAPPPAGQQQLPAELPWAPFVPAVDASA